MDKIRQDGGVESTPEGASNSLENLMERLRHQKNIVRERLEAKMHSEAELVRTCPLDQSDPNIFYQQELEKGNPLALNLEEAARRYVEACRDLDEIKEALRNNGYHLGKRTIFRVSALLTLVTSFRSGVKSNA